jgi:multiple sugar transport system ATP-binding protein
VARVDGRTPPQKGSVINLVPDHGHVHLFNTETGQRIGD